MSDDISTSIHQRWAQFRFAIVAPLLISPPDPSQLSDRLLQLTQRAWRHPVSGETVQFGFSTIERWFYQARHHVNPVTSLQRKVRCDAGQCKALPQPVREELMKQYQDHPSWSCRLHHDNLEALFRNGTLSGTAPSYSSTRRFMRTAGMQRRKRRTNKTSAAAINAEQRIEQREVRSYETDNVNALWHLDFHHGSRRLSLPNGQWATPMLLGILDDHSRLICHAQWYLAETAENLIHALCQGFQKRGLPRSLMTDNGSAMVAAETRQGLARLSILHETILPYSPYQNGKQEVFWAQVEGRLLPMLENVPDSELDLNMINQATQAWIEKNYHHTVHSETKQTPIDRFLDGNDLGRPSPGSHQLKEVFTQQERRTQRRSDGTLTVNGVRFELPSRYRSLQHPTIRYVRWDLSRVLLVDPDQDIVLCSLFPQDKTNNADGLRRNRSATNGTPGVPEPANGENKIAPLLRKCMADYSAHGTPPAYIHQPELPNHDSHAAFTAKTGEVP